MSEGARTARAVLCRAIGAPVVVESICVNPPQAGDLAGLAHRAVGRGGMAVVVGVARPDDSSSMSSSLGAMASRKRPRRSRTSPPPAKAEPGPPRGVRLHGAVEPGPAPALAVSVPHVSDGAAMWTWSYPLADADPATIAAEVDSKVPVEDDDY